jgi:hypothetical protein
VRGLLGRLGLRGAVVAGLAVLVLIIVGVARLSGSNDATPRYPSDLPATSTIDPTTGEDGVAAVVSPYPDDGAVRTAAEAFTVAWLRSGLDAAAWIAGITPLTTESLAQSLAGVDSAAVPATHTVAGPTIVERSDDQARTSTTLDTGKLLLHLLKQGGRWLVKGVDWEGL